MLGRVSRRSLNGKVRICDSLKNEKDELIVWWYGGITKNYRAGTVPKVVVFFRKLDKDNKLGIFVRKDIALTFLGLLRIGSIWQAGSCRSEAVFPFLHEKFDVDFSQESWKFVSPAQAVQSGESNPISQIDYQLPFSFDRNWLLDFPLKDGGNLLIPCLEFLVRCYGRSEEVPRVLATYPWQQVQSRFYLPFDQPAIPNTWSVKLTSRVYNGDIVCLAHMLYDQYAERAAKNIYSQIETSFGNGNPFAFIKVAPWFQGDAQVLVSGLRINNGRTFLALRILGCSDPLEDPIQRDRENSNKADEPAERADVEKAWNGTPRRVLKRPPEIVDLTDDKEPDQGAASVEIEEPEFVVLGEQRIVIDVKRDRATTKSGTPGSGKEPGSFASGEPHGTGRGVGHASIHARPVMESQGMLRDMWKAMGVLKKKHPDSISSVEWFTFEDKYSTEDKPKLVGLKPFEGEEVSTEIRNWLYHDTTKKIARGILVARIMVRGKSIYITEIQRRGYTREDEDGNSTDSEESFKGYIFILNDHAKFESWLRNLLSEIRYKKGVVQKLVGGCPGVAAAFKHSKAIRDVVSCESAVINALSKVGVKI